MLPKNKANLETPCLILDLDLLESNIRTMQDAANRAGKNLRPHAKTHKCSALARKQLEAGAIGICAAKLSEAEVLVEKGIENVLITGPVAVDARLDRLVELLTVSSSLTVAVDHPLVVDTLNAKLAAGNMSMDVLLDIDVGLNRTGVAPSRAMAFARHIQGCSQLRLKGIQAYAGQVQHIESYAERTRESLGYLEDAVAIFRQLSAASPDCKVFSASGTGTFDIDTKIGELTELQVGSYVCMDAEYLGIGSAGNASRFVDFAPALRLLTKVVSANHETFVTVDAGLKSMYQHGGIPEVMRPEGGGLEYDWFGDEYGRISSQDPALLLGLGDMLELVVSHCDPTINLFDRYVLTRGEDVEGTWPIDLRGCSQ